MVTEASDSLRLALDELVKVEQRLTPREREAGKLNLRARELLVEQMLENLDGIIQQRLDELRGPLLLRIRDAVRVVRVREGYHLALDRAMGGLEIDADETIDITRAIVAELRRPRTERPLSTPRETPGRSLRP
jgi:Skp family chaperone for outer membrane proteins